MFSPFGYGGAGYYDDDDSDDYCDGYDHTPVEFLRPGGDTEGKDVQWCLDNDFFQVHDGLGDDYPLWSGPWYYKYHPEERSMHQQRLKDTKQIRTKNEHRSRVSNTRFEREMATHNVVEEEVFRNMLQNDLTRMGYPKNHLRDERLKRQRQKEASVSATTKATDVAPDEDGFSFNVNYGTLEGSRGTDGTPSDETVKRLRNRGEKKNSTRHQFAFNPAPVRNDGGFRLNLDHVTTQPAAPFAFGGTQESTISGGDKKSMPASVATSTAMKQPAQPVDVFVFGGRPPDVKKMKSGTRYITKSLPDESKHLIGARAYYTETLYDPYIEGLELIYSDGSSTKCGNCSLKRMSDAMPFGKYEHIIGIDFREGGGKGKLIALSLHTSHSEGRRVAFCITCDNGNGSDERAEEFYADHYKYPIGGGSGERDDDGYLPFIGVYDRIVGKVGEKFTCKRGKRVTGIEFNRGKIIKMTQERIPNDQNRKWWKKSLGYEPNEDLKLRAKTSKEDYSYLVGVQACYVEGEHRLTCPIIVGLKLRYSDGQTMRWGRSKRKKKSEEFPFEKDEHIIGIDFDTNDNGITSLKLYTSNFGGRTANFSHSYRGGISAEEDGGDYAGLYSDLGDEFICGRGNRVTGITFKDNLITGMEEEEIPAGQNEMWWERSCDYNSDRDPQKVEKRRLSRAKWQEVEKLSDLYLDSDSDDSEYVCDEEDDDCRSTSNDESSDSDFDEEMHARIVLEVERQHQLVMEGHEAEYDSEGNYHPHSGGRDSNHGFDGC